MIVRRKPLYLEAWQLDSDAVGHWHKMPPFVFEAWKNEELFLENGYYAEKPIWCIFSKQDDTAEDGDYILKDKDGKLFFCRKLKFHSEFEVVTK